MGDLRLRLVEALAGQYTIDREIGRGALACVYLAEEHKHQRRVAMKVLRPELTAGLTTARFHREIAIAASLHHPHILPLLERADAAQERAPVADAMQGGLDAAPPSRDEAPNPASAP